jgi:hypothetical protein
MEYARDSLANLHQVSAGSRPGSALFHREHMRARGFAALKALA